MKESVKTKQVWYPSSNSPIPPPSPIPPSSQCRFLVEKMHIRQQMWKCLSILLKWTVGIISTRWPIAHNFVMYYCEFSESDESCVNPASVILYYAAWSARVKLIWTSCVQKVVNLIGDNEWSESLRPTLSTNKLHVMTCWCWRVDVRMIDKSILIVNFTTLFFLLQIQPYP